MLFYNILVAQKYVKSNIDKICEIFLYQIFCEVKKIYINLCDEVIFICDL